ncbi:MAG: hypothetical protein WD971_14060, partial [Pirellulales bacterium]
MHYTLSCGVGFGGNQRLPPIALFVLIAPYEETPMVCQGWQSKEAIKDPGSQKWTTFSGPRRSP